LNSSDFFERSTLSSLSLFGGCAFFWAEAFFEFIGPASALIKIKQKDSKLRAGSCQNGQPIERSSQIVDVARYLRIAETRQKP